MQLLLPSTDPGDSHHPLPGPTALSVPSHTLVSPNRARRGKRSPGDTTEGLPQQCRRGAAISIPVQGSKSRRDRAHGVSPAWLSPFQHLPITEQVTSPPRSPSPAGEVKWGAREGGSQSLPAPQRVLGLGPRVRGGDGAEHHARMHVVPAPRSTVRARRHCCPSAGMIYLPETPQFKC